MSNMITAGSYVDVKNLSINKGVLPFILEHDTHFSISLLIEDITYHRHMLKGGAEAIAMLADFWPSVESMNFDYGTSPLTTLNRSYATRKTVTYTSPQSAQNMTVVSRTSNTVTVTTNTLKRATLTSSPVVGANSFTIASGTGWTVGMRINIVQSGKLTTETYIESISGNTITIAQYIMDTYTSGTAVVYQHFIGRYLITNPTTSVKRFRIINYTGDTFTIATNGVDLTTLFSNGATVRVSQEVFFVQQWMLSTTNTVMIIAEHKQIGFYGDSLEHQLCRFYLRPESAQVMNSPLVLYGDYNDYLVVRAYDPANTTPSPHFTIVSKVVA